MCFAGCVIGKKSGVLHLLSCSMQDSSPTAARQQPNSARQQCRVLKDSCMQGSCCTRKGVDDLFSAYLWVQVAHIHSGLLIAVMCMLPNKIGTHTGRNAPTSCARSHIMFSCYSPATL